MERIYTCSPYQTVQLQMWFQNGIPDIVELSADDWKKGYRQSAIRLYLQGSKEAALMGKMAIDGSLPPEILADWIEDHPEAVRQTGDVAEATQVICERLRSVTRSMVC
jgi:hypothetical protein